jgi:hypothetical protein
MNSDKATKFNLEELKHQEATANCSERINRWDVT